MSPEVRPMPAPRLLAAVMAALLLTTAAPAFAAPVAKGEKRISVSVASMSLGDAIRLVAQQGRLDVVLEDDLAQLVSVDFRNVAVQDALDTLFDMGGVSGVRRGNVIAVMTRKKAFERGLFADSGKIFRLKYASAQRVAEFLNNAILTRPYSGQGGQQQGQGQQMELAKADPRANAVLVVGTAAELRLAEKTVAALDVPMGQRIFKLSHANAVDVASLLNATLFATGMKSPGDTVKADVETVKEGDGALATGGNNQVGANTTTIRTRTVTTQQLAVEAKTSMAVPDTRSNAVIVMGSPEVLAIVAGMLPQLDKAAAQVSIEIEVVELNTQDALDLGVQMAGQVGGVVVGGDPANAASPNWTMTYDPAVPAQQAFRARLNALVKDRKAKLVAHPTVLASDNTESQINIVDEVIKGTRIANQGTSSNGQNLIIVEPIFGAAGVTLNILPKIGADGQVTMRLHPTVSSVRETQRDSLNNPISLLSRRELVSQQVIVPSGTSLALGGLTQTNNISQAQKLPLLGDFPILGALFNNSSWSNQNSELMIVVTPRIQPTKAAAR